MQTLSSYFYAGYNKPANTGVFKKTLYSFVAVKCIYWLVYFELYYGTNSIIYAPPFSIGSLRNSAFLLYNLHLPWLSATVLWLVLALCIWQLFVKYIFFVPDLIIWIGVLNLHNQVYQTLSGGDYLLNQFLFFNCFIVVGATIKENLYGLIKVLVHNVAVLAIILQLCFAYLISGLTKLVDQSWQNGQAIFETVQVKHFAMYAFPPVGAYMAGFYKVITFIILVYQLSFPVLLWVSRIKKPFLLFGVCMHLYIGLVMGLPWFAFTMIIGYIYLWPLANQTSPSELKS